MDLYIKLFALFIIYSFVGWIIEVLFVFYDTKKLVNRGFLVGPLLPIYGCGSLLMAIFLYRYSNQIITLFVMAVFICSILEYFTSYIMEKLFKLRWWDYSDKRFQINGRVCLENAFLFGILGLLMVLFINPFFNNLLDMIPIMILRIVVGIVFVLFLIDLIVSFYVIKKFGNVAKSVNKDNTAEITKKVREYFIKKGGLYERITKAFDFEASERLIKDVASKAINTVNKAKDTAISKAQETKKSIEAEYKKTIEKLNKEIEEAKKLRDKKINNIEK